MKISIDKSKQLLSHYQRLFNSLNGDYRLSQVQASELSHSIDTALDIMSGYQMMELDCKADIVAMLKELKKEVEEIDSREHECNVATQWCIDRDVVAEIIQQKINALKGEQS